MDTINFDIYNIVAPTELKTGKNGNYVFEIVSKENCIREMAILRYF